MTNILNTITSQYKIQQKPEAANNNSFSEIKLDMSTHNKIKPIDPKGRMLKSRIFGSPVEYVKDLKNDIVSISKGANGKANDYELGRMNDLAMKGGALALATYLFVKNPLHLRRSMEFIGAGTFFAGMALWPKLFIQAPLKLMHGVDIHQKYEDSYGRKKMFFQDPQYLPWDLVDSKELNKMGDKMGIAKNEPNRENLIKEKAQKIAVQGNTLWMLTAGFATPLISALSCNSIEKFLLKAQEKKRLAKTQDLLENAQLNYPKFKNVTAKKDLEKFLSRNAQKPINAKNIDDLVVMLEPDGEAMLRQSIKAEIQNMVTSAKNPLDADFVQKMFKNYNVKNLFDKYKITPELIESFIKSEAKEAAATVDDDEVRPFVKRLTDFIVKEKSLSKLDNKFIYEILTENSAIPNVVKRHNAPTFATLKKPLTGMFDMLDDYAANRRIVNEYIDARVGDTAETFIANQWQRVNERFLKILGISKKDLLSLKESERAADDLIMERLAVIAKDNNKYKKAVSELSAEIAKYTSTVDDKFIDSIDKEITNMSDYFGLKFKNANFENIASEILGYDIHEGLKTDLPGSAKNALKSFANDRVLGAQSCFYRSLQTLDLFRRIETGTLDKQMSFIMGKLPFNMKDCDIKDVIRIFKGETFNLPNGMFDKVQEELVSTFGKNIKNIELEVAFEEAANGAKSKETIEYITKQIDEYTGSKISYEDLIRKIKESLKFESPKVKQTIFDSALDLAEEKKTWHSFGTLMEEFISESDIGKKEFMKKAEKICKHTLMKAKITDHTEKLNNLGPKQYKAIMNLLFSNHLDDSTDSVLEQSYKPLKRGLKIYKERFIDKIADWQYWYKNSHVLRRATRDMNVTERHLLVGSTVTDMVRNTGESLYNTNRWLRMFGLGAVALAAVTLAVQPFFGKIDKNKSFGEQK